jgi:integrase
LRLVWQCAGALDHPFGPLVRLMILTGQRRQEVAGMRRSELDGDVWVIPGARTKNGLEHGVPLSPAAAAIIGSLPEIGRGGFVLTTTGATPVSGFSRAKRRLDALMLADLRKGDPEARLMPWTFHDLRRTMASGMARLNVPLPVIEKALNHASGSFAGIVGVYQRHDYLAEKRRAFETWANHVETLAHGRAANVLPLARAGR